MYDACIWKAVDDTAMDAELLTALQGTDAVLLQAFGHHVREKMPLNIPEVSMLYKGNKNDFTAFLAHLKTYYTDSIRQKITSLTEKQHMSSFWKKQRLGSLSSTTMHTAAGYTKDDSDNYIVKLIMGESSFFGNSATEYGKKIEAVARKCYKISMKHHKSLKIKLAGLFINNDNPILRCSPDGVVTCKCCGTGLLEIKCPYKTSVRSKSPEEVAVDGKYHIYIGPDKELHLKASSPWFTQVQSHLFVTEYPWCDFVLFTEKSPYIMVERIYPQSEFGERINKALMFYKKFIFPKLTGE